MYEHDKVALLKDNAVTERRECFVGVETRKYFAKVDGKSKFFKLIGIPEIQRWENQTGIRFIEPVELLTLFIEKLDDLKKENARIPEYCAVLIQNSHEGGGDEYAVMLSDETEDENIVWTCSNSARDLLEAGVDPWSQTIFLSLEDQAEVVSRSGYVCDEDVYAIVGKQENGFKAMIIDFGAQLSKSDASSEVLRGINMKAATRMINIAQNKLCFLILSQFLSGQKQNDAGSVSYELLDNEMARNWFGSELLDLKVIPRIDNKENNQVDVKRVLSAQNESVIELVRRRSGQIMDKMDVGNEREKKYLEIVMPNALWKLFLMYASRAEELEQIRKMGF